ncbi:MAG: hypothetical protein B7Z55_14915, partial [Planctomycetales bacterium 12-60-4]
NARQQQGGGRGGFNPLAMMMGGGAGQGRAPEVELTIGVDRQTSHLIVSCNETLFRQIEDLVLDLDERARAAQPVVRIMPLATADPMVISQTLSSLIPKVTVSTTRVARTQPGQPAAPGRPSGASPGGNPQGDNPLQNPAGADFFRQMMEERARSRFGGDGSRGPGGFNPGGGFGRDRGGEGGFPRGPR